MNTMQKQEPKQLTFQTEHKQFMNILQVEICYTLQGKLAQLVIHITKQDC